MNVYITLYRDEEFAWAKTRLVRSPHGMWTLQVLIMDRNQNVAVGEHILVSPSQIDNLQGVGLPVKNPIPPPPPLKKRIKW